MNKDDGGPAFPEYEFHENVSYKDRGGMTLRDYLAAKAMQGILASGWYAEGDAASDNKSVALHSYEIADAMLAERAK